MATDVQWVRRDFGNGLDYLESIDDVLWADAPLPPRLHRCRPQTRGWVGLDYVERCACGAARMSSRAPWVNKNETRQARKQRSA